MLGVVLCFIYQAWHEDYGNRLPAATVAQTAKAPDGGAAETAATADQTGDTAAAVSSDGQTLRVETVVYIAAISTLGGEIRRIELKQNPANKDKPEERKHVLAGKRGAGRVDMGRGSLKT